MDKRLITLSELEYNATAASCWVAYRGRVYDVTRFAHDHPGGEALVLQHGGKDITHVLHDPLSHRHSPDAIDLLQGLEVGRIHEKYTNVEEDCKEKFLDLTKPLFDQMLSNTFTKSFYLQQVHRPRYTPESPLLFSNPYLELLTRTPWYVVPLFWTPLSLVFAYLSLQQATLLHFASLCALGTFMFGLVEYTVHRFLFHVDDFLPDHPTFLFLHFMLHGVHHYLPMDRMRLVMPPVLSLALGLPILFIHVQILPLHIAYGVLGGLIVGYMFYDLMHYFLHHAVVARHLPAHFQEMKVYHLAHHYQDYTTGFGITSKIWDSFFSTELTVNPKIV